MSTGKIIHLDPSLTSYTSAQKWITNVNVRPETVKLLEKKIRKTLDDIGLGNDFMNMTPKTQATKLKFTNGIMLN